MSQEKVVCSLCETRVDPHDVKPLSVIYHPLDDVIRTSKPDLPADAPICSQCRISARRQLLEDMFTGEKREIKELERAVVASFEKRQMVARNTNVLLDQRATAGDRVADRVATFGGSWKFIITFAVVVVGWMILNAVLLTSRPFDPFPFILLNLVLSCIAALQAPFIMMSQNRQAAKDRLRAEMDYQINLKAEMEIHQLDLKLDQLLHNQWQRLLEIQQIQLEVLEDLNENGNVKKPQTRTGA